MNEPLETRLHRAVLPATLKGKATYPSVGIDDKGFIYVPAIKTDLAARFAQVREQLGVRKVA